MKKIALLIPCLNEELTIVEVIKDFKDQFSNLDIYVIDNGSSDDTAILASNVGATIISEPKKGKGNAVRRGFADIMADIYILVDGDGTYDAASANKLVELLIKEHLDMVVGCRAYEDKTIYRKGHRLGNMFFNYLFKNFFGNHFTDIFSGYRVFTRRFVKSFPATSYGFEIETELSVHTVNLRLRSQEVDTKYKLRPLGSQSKLRTIKDGLRILKAFVNLLRLNKPMVFYCFFSLLFLIGSSLLGIPVLLKYFEIGLVPRFPSLIVSVGFFVISVLLLITGIILQTMLAFQIENRRLAFLAVR
jgi:glycosyltransferase involved in cell wall biosynthesis